MVNQIKNRRKFNGLLRHFTDQEKQKLKEKGEKWNKDKEYEETIK